MRYSGSSLHEPRERVAGANEPPPPRVAPDLESLDGQALETAADYAGARDSSALIVTRHEHIVFEKYWQGTGFQTLADGQSFARVVAALAAGAALSRRQIRWPDEPIGDFLPQWRADPRGAITVSQLLRADRSADPQLLALVIERATGMRYAQFVSEAIWRRIGASDAWLWLDRPGGNPHVDCCMLARQGDWIRVAGLLIRDGNYRGDEVMRPGWIAHLLALAKGNGSYGSYLRLGRSRPAGADPYATDDLFVIDSAAGNRLWLVPSLQLAILRMGRLPPRAADWDDAAIPNLIIRGARDYHPPLPPGDISKIVPGH